MSAYFKQKGDPTRYNFVDRFCMGRKCFAPGKFQHRAPLACGGSMLFTQERGKRKNEQETHRTSLAEA